MADHGKNTLRMALAVFSAAALSACSSVPIWEPPGDSAADLGGGVPIIEKSTGASSRAAARPKPSVQEPEAQSVPLGIEQPPREEVPETSAGETSFEKELKAVQGQSQAMQPGFVVTGVQSEGEDGVEITLQARNQGESALTKKMVIRVPASLMSRIGIETPDGVRSLTQWFTSGARISLKADGDASEGASLQVRAKSITFADGAPGFAVDISNTKTPGRRDVIFALREADAGFVQVESEDSDFSKMSLRDWLTLRADVHFKTPALPLAPLSDSAVESWAAFTSVKNLKSAGVLSDAEARELLPKLQFSLVPDGLAGAGVIKIGSIRARVTRCRTASSGDLSSELPVCSRDTSALERTARVSSGASDPEFAEIAQAKGLPAGIGGILLKAGDTLLTADQGRIFFWKKVSSEARDNSRVFETVSIDTTR